MFKFNSYIDAKRWDGPLKNKASGDKLTSTISITGNKNGKGELTGITAASQTQLGHTPFGTPRDFYPGLGSEQNKFSVSPTSTGMSVNFKHHASVSPIEEIGMQLGGYIVDVAQKLDVNVMQYNQPSFIGTFKAPEVGNTTPLSGPRGSMPSTPRFKIFRINPQCGIKDYKYDEA